MYPRANYEMTEDDLAALLDACKAVPAMMIGGSVPSSPQQNANDAWARLGKKMGFDSKTVQPIPGKGTRFFTAVPSETEEQREARLSREATEARDKEISLLQSEIGQLQQRLNVLLQ